MQYRWLAAIVAVVVALTAGTAGAGPAPWSGFDSGEVISGPSTKVTTNTPIYMIELSGEPAATYAGGVAGLKATDPQLTGVEKLDAQAPETKDYVEHLLARQETFVDSMERALGREVRILFNYKYVLNGVAAVLTAVEADLVSYLPGVTAVELSPTYPLNTDSGPIWIGAPGVWDGSAVPNGGGTMGEGVVVGILDTGINMDHPSFAAIGSDGYEHTNPYGAGRYKGYCDPEHPNHDPILYPCNSKLVGVWGFEASGAAPEDDNGHGSHTAGTAAGNFLDASIVAPTLVLSTSLQGVAPHANIIAYDVCQGAGCQGASIIGALDQAVDDGVDVTNYSIGGGGDNDIPWSDQNLGERGWRNVRRAGIIAATSAGNAGPNPATTAKTSPWYAAIAASTHNRVVQNTVADMTGGDTDAPADLVGRGLTDGYGPAPIVYAAGYMKADATPDDGQCMTPFPAGTFPNGEIVVCMRGVIARTLKGEHVLAGGAGGFVLANTAAEGNSITGDAHFLPGVHINFADGEILKAWLASGTGHMATISGTEFNRDAGNGDQMAAFSSRGPSIYQDCCIRPWGILSNWWMNLLKPDVTAPGVDIWAPWATDQTDPAGTPEYSMISGTSMSGPHVAGAFALMRALHPDWTPAEIQTALMLTAVNEGIRKEDNVTPADPFDFGAGRINVSYAANAGFTLDMTLAEAEAQNPSTGADPSTLNLASMANFRCLGGCSWTRVIDSTWSDDVEWTVSTEGQNGLTIMVEPTSFTLPAGGSQAITVTADVSAVDLDTFTFGQVNFEPNEGPHPAHMPVAVRAASYAVPHTIAGEIPPYVVMQGYSAKGMWTLDGMRSVEFDNLTANPIGLAVPEHESIELAQDPTNNTPFDGGDGVHTSLITVPDGAMRFTVETEFSTAADIDIFVGRDLNNNGIAEQTELACVGSGASWQEYCGFLNPPAGQWWVLIQNWQSSEPGISDPISFYYGYVAPGATGLDATVPASVENDVPWGMTFEWELEDLEPGNVFYGMVQVMSGTEVLFNMAVDLIGIEAPPAIFLPDVRKNYNADVMP